MSFFFQDEESFAESAIDDAELEVLNFADGYGGCKIGEFVRFIKNVGGNLVEG